MKPLRSRRVFPITGRTIPPGRSGFHPLAGMILGHDRVSAAPGASLLPLSPWVCSFRNRPSSRVLDVVTIFPHNE